MKIIRIAQSYRESRPECLVADNIDNEIEAQTMLKALRATCYEHSPYYYDVVPDDHRLWRGMAEYAEANPIIVYVVQPPPMVVDREKGHRYQKYSLTDAERFGQIKFLVPNENWTHVGEDPQGLLELLRTGLIEFEAKDYLLLIGAPHVIAMAAIIAANRAKLTGNILRLLLWRRLYKVYEPVEVPL